MAASECESHICVPNLSCWIAALLVLLDVINIAQCVHSLSDIDQEEAPAEGFHPSRAKRLHPRRAEEHDLTSEDEEEAAYAALGGGLFSNK